jgi:hypothetical protein
MGEVMRSREEILALLRVFMERHRATYKLTALGIFGSVARGDARDDSDVDIVFTTDDPNLFRTSRMRADLEAWLSRPVDVVRFRDRMDPELKRRILQEAQYV